MSFTTKCDEIRKTDKTWKTKSDLEKQDKYVDTALMVSRIVLFCISYYGRVTNSKTLPEALLCRLNSVGFS